MHKGRFHSMTSRLNDATVDPNWSKTNVLMHEKNK